MLAEAISCNRLCETKRFVERIIVSTAIVCYLIVPVSPMKRHKTISPMRL